MILDIKLYRGLINNNENLKSFGLNKFRLEIAKDSTLDDLHRLLNLNPKKNLVSIVNGRAQLPEYVLREDCSISIFPPMSDRQYNFFEKI
jgi:hypothetical protein